MYRKKEFIPYISERDGLGHIYESPLKDRKGTPAKKKFKVILPKSNNQEQLKEIYERKFKLQRAFSSCNISERSSSQTIAQYSPDKQSHQQNVNNAYYQNCSSGGDQTEQQQNLRGINTQITPKDQNDVINQASLQHSPIKPKFQITSDNPQTLLKTLKFADYLSIDKPQSRHYSPPFKYREPRANHNFENPITYRLSKELMRRVQLLRDQQELKLLPQNKPQVVTQIGDFIDDKTYQSLQALSNKHFLQHIQELKDKITETRPVNGIFKQARSQKKDRQKFGYATRRNSMEEADEVPPVCSYDPTNTNSEIKPLKGVYVDYERQIRTAAPSIQRSRIIINSNYHQQLSQKSLSNYQSSASPVKINAKDSQQNDQSPEKLNFKFNNININLLQHQSQLENNQYQSSINFSSSISPIKKPKTSLNSARMFKIAHSPQPMNNDQALTSRQQSIREPVIISSALTTPKNRNQGNQKIMFQIPSSCKLRGNTNLQSPQESREGSQSYRTNLQSSESPDKYSTLSLMKPQKYIGFSINTGLQPRFSDNQNENLSTQKLKIYDSQIKYTNLNQPHYYQTIQKESKLNQEDLIKEKEQRFLYTQASKLNFTKVLKQMNDLRTKTKELKIVTKICKDKEKNLTQRVTPQKIDGVKGFGLL
eukprot:403330813